MIDFVIFSPEYIEPVSNLHQKYLRFLEDDYSEDTLADIINRTYPFFWVILSDKSFVGFVYLENIIGNGKKFHSAELTTCFNPKYWGDFSKVCAKLFLQKCFDEFGFTKIKTLVYPENVRALSLLRHCGFEKEATLKFETMCCGKNQDIDIYSLFCNERK